MKVKEYVIFFIIFIVLSYIYKNLKLDESKNTSKYYYKMVNTYLLNGNNLGINNKPYLWIHLHCDNTITPAVNSRHWLNFGSRATTEINQPYQYLTIKSIIDKCGDDFNICLIDDKSFKKIIPDWSIDLDIVANPIKTHIRQLALCSLLNIYGGILLPSSFICLNNLKELYESNIRENKMFVGEFINRSENINFNNNLLPSTSFMGCNAGNIEMQEFIKYLEVLNSTDFTAEQDFLGKTNNWLFNAGQQDKINIINGRYIGTRKDCGKPVLVDELLGSSYIKFYCRAVGIYIPWNEIINRTSFQWFSRLSPEQVLESDTIIGKQLLINN